MLNFLSHFIKPLKFLLTFRSFDRNFFLPIFPRSRYLKINMTSFITPLFLIKFLHLFQFLLLHIFPLFLSHQIIQLFLITNFLHSNSVVTCLCATVVITAYFLSTCTNFFRSIDFELEIQSSVLPSFIRNKIIMKKCDK